MNSNLTFNISVGTGTQTAYPITASGENMGYFRTSDITGYVDGVEVQTTINPSTPHMIIFTIAPKSGSTVMVRREMPIGKPYANFERGNNFGHRQVNNTFLQQLYLTQELLDGFLPKGFYWKQDIDMGGFNIYNVNKVITKGIEADVASIGYLSSDLDMGDHRLLNLPIPRGDKEPIRKGDLSQVSGVAPSFLYVDSKIRTDSASQLGLVYADDWSTGIVIHNGAMSAKLAYWYNGQFYSVGTDTKFTSNDFDADLAAGRFVSANLTTQMQQWRDVGYVKGWLNQHDDTLMIDAALSSGNGYIKLEAGRIYNVDGGVLYTRKWQVLDLNGSTIRLKDNAANRKTVLEQDDYSQIINGSVDGNWQSNNSGAQTWRKDGRLHVDLSPESHGIAQRRYDTNNNVIRNAKGAFIDQVKIHDTLRSNILSCGSSSIGTAELENSYCDHQLYISGNGTSGQFGGHFEHVKIRGFCNSDALSVSSTGESTGLSFGKVSLRDITMTPWRSDSTLDTDKYGSRWIECRENTSGTVLRSTITFDSIDIDDTRTELDLLYDNARKCRFRDWHVSIDSLTIRTQLCPASAVTADFQVLDVRNETTSVSIQNFHFEIDSPTPLSAEMAVVSAQNRSVITIGVLTGKMIVEGITTAPRWIMNVDSTITVGSVGFIQNKGTVLWNRSVNYQSKITIGSDNGVSGYTKAIVNRSDNAAINPVINNVTGRSITLEGGDITNKPISGFLVGAIDLGLASGVVGDIDNAYVGQKVEIIWNGVCKKSGGNIRWLNKIEPAETPTIGSFSILRYSKHNGMWVESSFVPF